MEDPNIARTLRAASDQLFHWQTTDCDVTEARSMNTLSLLLGMIRGC
jgi:hypothetical protein